MLARKEFAARSERICGFRPLRGSVWRRSIQTGRELPDKPSLLKLLDMDKLRIKGNRNVIKGKLKQRWSKLTDDDLKYAEGKEEESMGWIQKRTGESRDTIREALEEREAPSEHRREA